MMRFREIKEIKNDEKKLGYLNIKPEGKITEKEANMIVEEMFREAHEEAILNSVKGF